MLDAVFFDFDGTVADTEPVFQLARDALADELSLSRGVLDNTPGTSTYDHFVSVARRFPQPLDPARMTKRVYEIAADMAIRRHLKPFPGIPQAVEALFRRGIPLWIVTSSERGYTETLLSFFGLLPFFAGVICGPEVGRCKPYPDAYLAALRQSGASAANSVAIEDTTGGAHSAVSAGIRCIGIAPPDAYIGHQDLTPCFSVLNDHREIPALLSALADA